MIRRIFPLPGVLLIPLLSHPGNVLALNHCFSAQSSALQDNKLARYFGNAHHGSQGRPGRDGRSGQNGSNTTLFVTGQSQVLTLSGRDGEDGEDGTSGEHAYCDRRHHRPDHDISAPNGGNGGRGGHGGNGGNGGNLTVYYQNPADLRLLTVQSLGGRGGRGGRGGYGGKGCPCYHLSWEQKICPSSHSGHSTQAQSKQHPSSPCQIKRYRCRGGSHGQSGQDGRNGKTGTMGQLRLVQANEPLQSDRPFLKLTSATQSSSTQGLSLNRWATRQGALARLGPGSQLRDEYLEYQDRLERQFQLQWNASRLGSLGNVPVHIGLKRTDQVEVILPDNVWAMGEQTRQGSLITYTVNQAIRAEDVTRLAIANFDQTRTESNLYLVDLGGQAKIIETEFEITIQSDSSQFSSQPRFKTRFEGVVPASLLERQDNRYRLPLHKLPISTQHLYKKPLRIQLKVNRRFAGRQANQELMWNGNF